MVFAATLADADTGLLEGDDGEGEFLMKWRVEENLGTWRVMI